MDEAEVESDRDEACKLQFFRQRSGRKESAKI